MGLGGQFDAQAVLPPAGKQAVQTGWVTWPVYTFWGREKYLYVLVMEPRLPGSLMAILTGLSPLKGRRHGTRNDTNCSGICRNANRHRESG